MNIHLPDMALPLRRAFVLIGLALLCALYPVNQALADTFDDQINALQNEVSQYQQEAGRLRAEANTLQNAIAALNAQQQALQKQIDANQVKAEQLQDSIVKTQERIVNQKQALGQNLRAMYLENSITPLEMIASSQSIGDFIDKQEYRNKIRDQVQKSLKEIKDLKLSLEKQKADVEQVLADQKAIRKTLDAQEAEKNKLLADTQGQEEAYKQLTAQKGDEIENLRAQQRALNAQFFGGGAGGGPPCGGGYPGMWCNIPMDSVVDNWGMYNRECVSYTAYRVAASGRYMPYGLGNANMWDDGARARGISVDSKPKVGDVAIANAGYYGHAMYVEAVHGNGTILVSQYNVGWDGTYSTATISTSGLVFIHF